MKKALVLYAFIIALFALLVVFVGTSSLASDESPSIATANLVSVTLSAQYPPRQAILAHEDGSILDVYLVWGETPHAFVSVIQNGTVLTPSLYSVEFADGTPVDFSSPEWVYYPIAPKTYYARSTLKEVVVQVDEESKTIRVWSDEPNEYRECLSGDGEYVYCEGEYVEFRDGTIIRTPVSPPLSLYSWSGRKGVMCGRGQTDICCANLKQSPMEWSCVPSRPMWDYGNKIAVTEKYLFSAGGEPDVIDIYRMPELSLAETISSPYPRFTNIVASDQLLYVYHPYTVTYVYHLLTSPVTASAVYLTSINNVRATTNTILATSPCLILYLKETGQWFSIPQSAAAGLLAGSTTYWGDTCGVWGYVDGGLKGMVLLRSVYNYSQKNDGNVVYAPSYYETWEIRATESGITAEVIADIGLLGVIWRIGEYVYFNPGETLLVRHGDEITTVLTDVLDAAFSGGLLWVYNRDRVLRRYSVTTPPSLDLVGETGVYCLWPYARVFPVPGGVAVYCSSKVSFVDHGGTLRWSVPMEYICANTYGIIGKRERDNTLLVVSYDGYTQTLQIQGAQYCNDKVLISRSPLFDIWIWEFTPAKSQVFLPLVIR